MAHGTRTHNPEQKHGDPRPDGRREHRRLLQVLGENAGLLLGGRRHVAEQLGPGRVWLSRGDGARQIGGGFLRPPAFGRVLHAQSPLLAVR
jgi:hypothetical protein